MRHARQQTRLTTMPDRVPPVRSFASGRERLTSSVYKVDKFAVPAASIDAFVAKLAEKAKEEARKRLGVGGAEALTLAGFRLLS